MTETDVVRRAFGGGDIQQPTLADDWLAAHGVAKTCQHCAHGSIKRRDGVVCTIDPDYPEVKDPTFTCGGWAVTAKESSNV